MEKIMDRVKLEQAEKLEKQLSEFELCLRYWSQIQKSYDPEVDAFGSHKKNALELASQLRTLLDRDFLDPEVVVSMRDVFVAFLEKRQNELAKEFADL